jgi:hypothetical protein
MSYQKSSKYYQILIICSILVFGCKQTTTNINKIEIHTVDKEIITCFRITCAGFDTSFSFNQFTIIDKITLNKIEYCLNKLNLNNSQYEGDIRTKAIITYNSRKKQDTLCIGFHPEVMYMNGRKYIYDNELFELIEQSQLK